MGFRRNLTAFEIAGQVREIVLRDPADLPTNMVFMGMGEPLLNWPAVDTALTILNAPDGLGIGARHITVSTVGILPGMAGVRAAAGAVPPRHLAACADLGAARSASCRSRRSTIWRRCLPRRAAFRKRVTFEYVMIAGVNDRRRGCGPARPAGAPPGRAGQHPAAASGRRAGPHADGRRADPGVRGAAPEPGGRGDGAAEPRTRHRRGVRQLAGEDGARSGKSRWRASHPERSEACRLSLRCAR